MKKLIREIHHRSLWQVLGIYLAGSWIALQVVETLADSIGFPEWVQPFAVVLLVVGFPIVIATAFVQEGMAAGPREAAQTETGISEAPEVAPEAPVNASAKPPHRKLLTWRFALLGGTAAFALLGVLTAAYLAMRASGIGPAGTLVAKGVLEERATVILADFTAADTELAEAATEALRVDLSQSSAIKLAEPAVVAAAIERTGQEVTAPLTPELAQEVAQREGAAAVIAGEINRAGVGYVFSVQILSAGQGEVLTSQRETAKDSTEVIAAIDRLSKRLRERIGESFRSIRNAPPLDRVTTADLEALKLYSEARRAGGQRALELYGQAVAIDSAFAMAWRGIGVVLRNFQMEPARRIEAFTRAFEHRNRLTERERRITAADYYSMVTFELRKAILEYEVLLQLDPENVAATNNLGVTYGELREYDRAEELYLRVLELDPDSYGTGYFNTTLTRISQGRFDAARTILDSATTRFGPDRTEWLSSILEATEGDLGKAVRILEEALDGASPGVRTFFEGDLAALTAGRGEIDRARAYLRGTMAALEEFERPVGYLADAVQAAWIDVAVRASPEDGLDAVGRALDKYPLADLEPLDRPYPALAEVYARAGETERAHALLAEFESEVPAELRRSIEIDVTRAEAEIALAEGRYQQAITAFRRADRGFCSICALSGLALAHEGAGERDSAIVVYRRYAETPFTDRFTSYTYARGPELGPVYERLGQLYDEAGDADNAALYYARFVELWAEADDELQPRVRAAQARLDEIVRQRG
jgi:tetratricopeptide (TPR) repeat protein